MYKILVVDDQRAIRNTFKELLEYEGYSVDCAVSGEEALAMTKQNSYNLVITDIKMGEMSGVSLFKEIHETSPDIPVLVISGQATVSDAVTLIKGGAYDLLEKPLNAKIVIERVRSALERGTIKEIRKTKKPTKTPVNDIIGTSPIVQDMMLSIELASECDAKVLITGSNGSGKELVAQRIHRVGKRAAYPFIEVNCAAIPSELIESELFGHEKGSFTSAIKQKKGQFELADKGTIFLDEVGDMALAAQAKLLRAIQEMKITRVGGDKDVAIDVRIIAATNKNLLEEIEKGNFRLDLYHRLNVLHIKVPSLEQRREDIPLLVNHFIGKICSKEARELSSITPEAVELLCKRSWPGNIRELANITERLIIYSRGQEISADLVRQKGMD